MSSPKNSDSNCALARLHPVDVAAQRIDFSVVRDVAERMRQRPARKRVRAESLVDDGQRGLDARIDRDRGNTSRSDRPTACLCRSSVFADKLDVEIVMSDPMRCVLGALADQVKLSFEFVDRS